MTIKRPRNVYALLASNQDITGDVTVTDTAIKGYRLRTGWNDIQPALGSIDLAYITRMVDLVEANGKGIGIGVSAGVSIPPIAFEQGVKKYTLLPEDKSIEKFPPDLAMPWDLKFQELWFKVIDALGAAFDHRPGVMYVVVSGFMQLMEDRLTGTAQGEADMTALAKAAGFADLATAWLASAKLIVARFATAFPTTAVILTTARPFPTNGSQVQGELLAWGKSTYPKQFGNMSASLHATLPPHASNPQPSDSPKGDQPIYNSGDHDRFYGKGKTPVPWPADPQPVDDLLANAAQGKGDQWVELYLFDCKNTINRSVILARGAELELNLPK